MSAPSKKSLARSVSHAAALKRQIDALTVEFKEVTDGIRPYVESLVGKTLEGDDGVGLVKIGSTSSLNKARAIALYHGTPKWNKITERVVTAASIKSGALTTEQVEALYDHGVSLTFGTTK